MGNIHIYKIGVIWPFSRQERFERSLRSHSLSLSIIIDCGFSFAQRHHGEVKLKIKRNNIDPSNNSQKEIDFFSGKCIRIHHACGFRYSPLSLGSVEPGMFPDKRGQLCEKYYQIFSKLSTKCFIGIQSFKNIDPPPISSKISQFDPKFNFCQIRCFN